MYTKQQRILYFIFGCLVVRSLLILLAKNANPQVLKTMAVIAIGIAAGFTYQYFVNPTKPGAFQNRPWWNYARPIHALLYLLFAIVVFCTPYEKSAWMFLLLDMTMGIVFFTIEYTKN